MTDTTAQTRETATTSPGPAGTPTLPSVDDVEEAMRDVVDPELGINVVDLGLVYGIHVGAETASVATPGADTADAEPADADVAGAAPAGATPAAAAGASRTVATIDMTLTSAACPLTDVIEDQTRSALTTGPGGGLVEDFRINWVWMPPWGPDKITDEGRDQLRALGFNV